MQPLLNRDPIKEGTHVPPPTNPLLEGNHVDGVSGGGGLGRVPEHASLHNRIHMEEWSHVDPVLGFPGPEICVPSIGVIVRKEYT